MNRDLTNRFHTAVFHRLAGNVAVIDRDFKIVEANQSFYETFGDWEGKYCYNVYKRSNDPCDSCVAKLTFEDGQSRTKEETCFGRNGQAGYYVVRTEAIQDENGSIPYVIEFSENLTESNKLNRAFRVLFDRVPCYVQVLDRDLRVVLANDKQRETFGESEGKFCYQLYKRRDSRCYPCPALQAFQDGKIHSSEQVGFTKDGRQTVYAVTAAPLALSGDEIGHVVEISMDVTEVRSLEKQLRRAYAMEESLINNSTDGIIAFNSDFQVIIYNPAAEKILQYPAGEAVSAGISQEMLPVEFRSVLTGEQQSCRLVEAELTSKNGEKIPVRFHGVHLMYNDGSLGWAVFFQDLRPLKELEQQKLEAERLSAVGETVAGLAHSVKNVLQSLEGGMYALRTGLEKKNEERMMRGWKVVDKNFDKVSKLVKDFLGFSKGRLPETEWTQPNDLIRDMITLNEDAAKKSKVELIADLDPHLNPAPLDPHGLDSCLTNLLSNAIDACQMSEKEGGRVVLRTREEGDVLVIEVSDNGCGMDYEVKKRVFTTFFTTKGGGGTGLGLLTTRKIIQEHGGKISMTSEPGRGTTFRIELPRSRLPIPK